MKNNKTCPKCTSKEIAIVRHSHPSKVRIGVTGKARISKYVCSNCGFIEEWVEYDPDLDKIKREYLR